MNICVYCSASNKIPQHYKDGAHALGEWIATSGHTLVYGGATGGLMTAVSEAAMSCQGQVIGIITQGIVSAGRQSEAVTELHCVDNMNERKALLKQYSDVFVALPGSYGTMDELFDVVASGTVGEHCKPMVLVNENGFYDHLISLIERMKSEAFIPQQERYKLTVVDSFDACVHYLEQLSTPNS